MSYNRAISTLGCAEFTLQQAIILAVQHDLNAIELRALCGTLDLPAHLASGYGTPAALAEELRGSPVKIAAFDTSLKLIGNTPADRQEFLRFVPWAEALNVPWLRVFDGAPASGALGMTEAVATMRWWQGLRAKNGWNVDVMVETHDTLLDAERISRFLSQAPGTPILWDAHHTWKRGGKIRSPLGRRSGQMWCTCM